MHSGIIPGSAGGDHLGCRDWTGIVLHAMSYLQCYLSSPLKNNSKGTSSGSGSLRVIPNCAQAGAVWVPPGPNNFSCNPFLCLACCRSTQTALGLGLGFDWVSVFSHWLLWGISVFLRCKSIWDSCSLGKTHLSGFRSEGNPLSMAQQAIMGHVNGQNAILQDQFLHIQEKPCICLWCEFLASGLTAKTIWSLTAAPSGR